MGDNDGSLASGQETPLTRGLLAVLLYKAVEGDVTKGSANTPQFTDVSNIALYKSLAINSQEIFTQEARMNAQKAESDKGKNESYRYPMLSRIAQYWEKVFRK